MEDRLSVHSSGYFQIYLWVTNTRSQHSWASPHCLLLLTLTMPSPGIMISFLKGYSFLKDTEVQLLWLLLGFSWRHSLRFSLRAYPRKFSLWPYRYIKKNWISPKERVGFSHVNNVSHKTSLTFLFGLPAKKCKIESESPASRCIAPGGTQCVGQPHYWSVLASPLPPHPIYSQFHESCYSLCSFYK